MGNSELTKRINKIVAQAHLNMDSESPSIYDEVIVAQHKLLEKRDCTIDNLREHVAQLGFEMQIMETRLDVANKKLS